MIYIVAFGGGLKCPRKIYLNTQWEGGNLLLWPIGFDGPDALDTKWADFDVEKVNELLE